jgi:hypothetical protein
MKKVIAFIITLFFNALYSQTLLTFDDIENYENTNLYRKKYVDSLPSNTGLNQIWNLSSIIGQGFWGYNSIHHISSIYPGGIPIASGANKFWTLINDWENNPSTIGYYENYQFLLGEEGFYKQNLEI